MTLSARGVSLLTWMLVFTVVCAIILLLRFQAARLTRRRVFLDDFFVAFAFALAISLEGVVVWAIFNGLGKHIGELSEQDVVVQLKLTFVSGPTWLLSTVFNKLAILWLYNRVFIVQMFQRSVYVVAAVTACYGIVFLGIFLAQCQPIEQAWNPSPGGWCHDLVKHEYGAMSVNMGIDLAIIIIPMPVLWSLRMARRNKIVVSVMFSVGFLTIGIMAWRLQFTVATRNSTDFTYNLSFIGLLALLELWLGLIVACLPTLAPVLKFYVTPAWSKLSSWAISRIGRPTQGSNQDQREPHKSIVTIGQRPSREPAKGNRRAFGKLSAYLLSTLQTHNDATRLNGNESQLELRQDKRSLERNCVHGHHSHADVHTNSNMHGIVVQQEIDRQSV